MPAGVLPGTSVCTICALPLPGIVPCFADSLLPLGVESRTVNVASQLGKSLSLSIVQVTVTVPVLTSQTGLPVIPTFQALAGAANIVVAAAPRATAPAI